MKQPTFLDPSKRYQTWNGELQRQFGEKIFKASIDGGFDCPNRDGTVAVGGCTFCSVSGSGDMILAPTAPLAEQFYTQVDFLHNKWNGVKKYIAYFQNFTNTHAPVDVLRERYEQVVNLPGVVGLSIGTRPDCLPDETIDYLAELNDRLYLWVELGLQTTYEETSDIINRAHSYEVYVDCVKRLRAKNIRVCTHLINGLPGETLSQMRENCRRMIQDTDIQGVKLHLMHLTKNTKMVRDYHQGRLKLMDKDTYVSLICDQLEMIPSDIIIHRLTGDAPREALIGPMWSLNKWEVLNAIDAELERRGSYQGKYNVRSQHVTNSRTICASIDS
jgi:radical SAM protein (TIGR01212 family)